MLLLTFARLLLVLLFLFVVPSLLTFVAVVFSVLLLDAVVSFFVVWLSVGFVFLLVIEFWLLLAV